MELKTYLKNIEKFLKDYLNDAKQDMYVLGLSGGVDSSLSAALARSAVGKDRLTCIAIPINSLEADLSDAKRVAEQLDVKLLVIDGSSAFESLKKEFINQGIKLDVATLANMKARIRMTILYAYAQKNRGLVLGTDNACERYTGYFTKYGDGGVDILPLAHLLKREVVEGCKIYGLSKDLAERTPSAGLYEGQTDEIEMGITYNELDDFLLGKEISEETKNKIERLHRINQHKLTPIPTPEDFNHEQ